MNGLFRLKPIVAAVASAVAAFGVHAQVPPPAALPAGGRVVAGQAAISQSGNNMLIQQDSAKAILNWNSFNIGSQASVVFQQPSASAIALNRVLGTDPSAIYGSLRANGQVFLINPSGVVFGAGARVDVGGLVASTLNIRDEDFLAGNYRFGREGATGSVLNEGELIGKYVALLAPEVRNEGVIVARRGTAALAAGDAVTLSLTGSDLVGVQVDKASIDTLVHNGRLIQADAGTVILSAQSASALVGKVVNTGAIEANGLTTDGGVVRLVASSTIEHRGSIAADAGQDGKGGVVTLIADLANPGSRTIVAGGISARGGSESGDGGFVDTSASRLKIEDGTRVDTRAPNGRSGLWLLDPTDFTVAATGGDMTGTLLGNNLGLGNVQIQSGTGASGTNGDVFINDPVSWSANTLTITAHRDINVNATMNVTGTGGLAVEYGQNAVEAGNTANFTVNAPVNMAAGTSFTSKLGSDGGTKNYTIVTDLAGLVAIDTDPTLNYALGANVVIASGTWTPLGNSIGPFDGTFEGLGHTVSGATYDAVTGGGFTPHDNVGFFGQIGNTGRIQNFGVTNVNFTGRMAVGGLVGISTGSIYNSYSTGTVSTSSDTTTEVVNGIGGLVGNFSGSGSIARSYSTATVTATAGDQADDIVFMVPGGGIGGLVGAHVGGGSKISDSYATGAVTGLNNVGGLVGHAAADIEKSYSTGSVSDNGMGGTVGGMVGSVVTVPASPLITDSFWDTQTSGQAGSAGGTGLTTAQMKTAANFTGAGWDTTRTWKIADGSYPVFTTGPEAPAGIITISLNDSSRVYGVTTAPTLTGFSYLGTLLAGDTLTGAGFGTALVDNLAVGDYAYSTANLISPTFGFSGGHTLLDYTISYSANKLSILKADLVLSGTRVYDATTNVTGGILTATGVLGESFAVSGSGTLASKDVGSRAVQALGTLALGAGSGGALASNYNVLSGAGSAVTITKANLSVSGLAASNKVYDATTTAVLTGTATVTALGSDTVTVAGTATGTFDTKNFGIGKAVTVTGNTLAGTDAGNYNIVQQAGLTADVAKADLSVTGLSASNKVYDATTTATLTGTASITALGSDVVTLGGTATGAFANKNIGAGKAVTVTGNTISGADAGNYNLVQQAGLTADITKANLSVTGLSASNKVYDTTTTATLTGTASITALGSDDVTLGGTAVGAFSDKNAGTGKAVTVSGNTISGTDAGNYNLVQQAGLTADIAKADLTVTGLAASNKVYDATTTAVLTGTATVTALGADVVTVGGTATGTFDTKNFGIGKAVTVTGNTLSGADAGNYNLIQQTGLTANITKADLAVTGLAASNKVYDATTTAVLTGTATIAALGTDVVTLGGTATGTFADKNVGDGKAVTVTGNTISGADAGNYNIIQQTGLTANITKANLAVTGLVAQNKDYDTTTTAVLTGAATITALGADDVTLGGAAVGAFADKNAGNGKAVTVTGNTISGADAGNYNLVQQAGLTANIAKVDLAVTGLSASNKVYDGTTAAALTGAATVTALGADVVTVGGTATGAFANKNAGLGKAVTVSGNTLSGTDAGNYNIVQQTGLTADITPKPLDITVSRPYDTTDQFTTGFTFGGVVPGDAAPTVTGGAATVSNKDNGFYNAFTSNTLALSDANYTAVGGAVSATISKKALTLLGLTAQDKTSDGSTAATLTGTPSLGGVLGGEDVTLTGAPSGAFADATVGNGKTVNVTGLTLAGADAANYTLTATLVASITAGGTSTTVANVVNSASNPLGPTTTTGSFRPTTTTNSFRPTTTTSPTPTTIRPTTTTVSQSEESTTTTTAPPPQVVRSNPVQVVFTPGEPVQIVAESEEAFDPDEEPTVTLSTTGDDATAVQIEVVASVDEDGNLVMDVVVPEDTPESIIAVTISAVDARGVTRTLVYLFPVAGPSTTRTTASDAL